MQRLTCFDVDVSRATQITGGVAGQLADRIGFSLLLGNYHSGLFMIPCRGTLPTLKMTTEEKSKITKCHSLQ